MITKFAPVTVVILLLSGCVVYPYESAFQSCDNEAGACYRYCEDTAAEDEIAACRSSCETEANICFDQAYAAQDYQTTAAYASPRPWYGSYGYWRPTYGYAFSLDYYSYGGRGGYYGDPYYARDRRRGRHGYRNGRGYRDGGRRGGRRGDRDGNRADGGRGGNRDNNNDGRRGGGRNGGDRSDGGQSSPPPRTPPPSRPPQVSDPAPRAAPPVQNAPVGTRAPRIEPSREGQRERVIDR